MGSALSSVFSINNCGCGATDLEGVISRINDIVEQTTEIKAKISVLVTENSDTDARINELCVLVKGVDERINSLITKIFDSMLPTFCVPTHRHSE